MKIMLTLLFTVEANVSDGRLDILYKNAATITDSTKPQLHYQLDSVFSDDVDQLSLAFEPSLLLSKLKVLILALLT